MYVIPIFERTINSIDTACIKQIWMLLERNGTYCSTVETVEDAIAYATENDIPLKGGEPVVSAPFIFLPVDSTSDQLDLFYTWNETRVDEQPMRHCWRPFSWIYSNTNANDDIWGTNVYLKDDFIGDNISVFDVVTEYFKCRLVAGLSQA